MDFGTAPRIGGGSSPGAGPPAHASTGTYLEGSFAVPAFAVPAGVAAGDVVVIPIYVNATTTVAAYPAGFAEAENSPQDNVSGNRHSLHVVWKRATAADTGTYDFTLSTPDFVSGAALRYTGCAVSGSPWDSPTDGAVDVTDGNTTPAVAVTTQGPGRLLVWAGTCWAGGTWTPPSGFAERIDQGVGLLTAADAAQDAVGASGAVTGVCTGTSKRSAWLGALAGATASGPQRTMRPWLHYGCSY